MLLGKVWNSSSRDNKYLITQGRKLKACSTIKLLERRTSSDLLEVTIGTGRPHQIRIHLASIGSPLIGDTLYGEKGYVNQLATPGTGGFLLHAHKVSNVIIEGKQYSFEADPPKELNKLPG